MSLVFFSITLICYLKLPSSSCITETWLTCNEPTSAGLSIKSYFSFWHPWGITYLLLATNSHNLSSLNWHKFISLQFCRWELLFSMTGSFFSLKYQFQHHFLIKPPCCPQSFHLQSLSNTCGHRFQNRFPVGLIFYPFTTTVQVQAIIIAHLTV